MTVKNENILDEGDEKGRLVQARLKNYREKTLHGTLKKLEAQNMGSG